MKLNREELNGAMESILNIIGFEIFVDDLTKAMSVDELQENLEYIDRLRDLNIIWDETRMKLNREELDGIVEQMIDMIGVENFVDDLTWALVTDELRDILEHIDRLRDLDVI